MNNHSNLKSGAVPAAQDKLDGHDFRTDIVDVRNKASVATMLETICLATGLRFAAIARVNERRWIACSVVDHLGFGLTPGDELDVESTLCHEVRAYASEIIINDVQCDDIYLDHHTPKIYGFRSYLSIPIFRPDGTFFGTLCALDSEPNRLDDERILKMVRLFAQLIGDSLHVEDKLHETQEQLAQERHLADVQERFLAILAHDLLNPVAAIQSGLRILAHTTGPQAKEIISLLEATTHRMTDLVNNLMDHARNRLGDGIVLDLAENSDLRPGLELIIAEFRTVAPDRQIYASMDLSQPINCDPARIAQLLSNLMGNAITHGAQDRPIRVSARVVDGTFSLRVANEGTAIPEEQLPSLFMPFKKGGDRPPREGLGLGLYIAAEIAKAHGGTMTVVSNEEETAFTFEMPC